MNTSPEFIADQGAADVFVGHLWRLTGDELHELARRVADVGATTAGDLEWWRATTAVSQRLRRLHRSHAAAVAAMRASEAVLGSPGSAALAHDTVVQVARAAGDVARVLVAGGPPVALDVFTTGWELLLRPASPPPAPTV